MENKYDVIVIGAGAAGLTAAIYTCRKALKTIVISKELGGQTMLASIMENYPAFKGTGMELMLKFRQQAEDFGADILLEEVVEVQKKDDLFTATTAAGKKFHAKSLILAFGKVPRNLGIPGEEHYLGKGVHVCATCDGPLYQGKRVMVIGGGNSALEAALFMADIAEHVILMHRREEFRADEVLVGKVKGNNKIDIMLNYIPTKFAGDMFLQRVTVENLADKKTQELALDGVFIEIGYHVRAAIVQHLVKLNDNKEVVVDGQARTSLAGIFAAGDVTSSPYKQTIIAAGEGAKAGLSAYAFLKGVDIRQAEGH